MASNPTTDPRITEGINALRVLLNLSGPNDRPNSRVSTLMDGLFSQEGKSMRVRLEDLWAALKEQTP